MHITIIECLPCTCAVPVSLICSQLFVVKAYGCVSLFYVCYLITSVIPILPTVPIHRYISNIKFTIIDMQGCIIIPELTWTMYSNTRSVVNYSHLSHIRINKVGGEPLSDGYSTVLECTKTFAVYLGQANRMAISCCH